MTNSNAAYHLPLAYGDLSVSDTVELRALKDQILRDIGFDCSSYKEQCLRRRIAVRMRARGLHRYSDYADLLGTDPGEQRRLLDAITINVSKFFRNPDLWRTLATHVVPRLFDSDADPIRIWSAGCAAGEEPYTVAILLKEHALRAAREDELSRFRIVGTDVDPQILQSARTGSYSSFAFTDIPDEIRRAWFVQPGYSEIKREIRDLVRFETTDLIRDQYEGDQHLIICRNVVIYFEREIQERLFVKFHEALAPGGILVLGKVETLFGRAASLFKPVMPRERVFVKV